jgi:uncharacterized protein (TIGR03067 family)
MRVPTIIALTVGLLLTADVPAQKEARDDKEKLQGTWTVAAEQISGKKLTAKEIENLQVVVRGNQMTFKDAKTNENAETLTFKLHPTRKPKAMDFAHKRDKKIRGIYQLNGDELTTCYAINDKKRPTMFQTKVGSQQFLFVLKRVKP